MILVFVLLARPTLMAQENAEAAKLPKGLIKFAKPEGVTTPPRLRLDRSFQSGRNCGPNALYVFLCLRGLAVSYEDVLAEMPVSDRGVTLAQIETASARLGHTVSLRKGVSPDELTNDVLPAIVHLRSLPPTTDESAVDHFAVLIDVEDGHFEAVDTTNMMMTGYSASALARNMTGYVAVSSWLHRVTTHLNRWLFFAGCFATFAVLAYDFRRRVQRRR